MSLQLCLMCGSISYKSAKFSSRLDLPRTEREARRENPPFITITAFSALWLPNQSFFS